MDESSSRPRASERRLIDLLTRGPLTRQQLVELSGLPARTVAGAANRLVTRGLLLERPETRGGTVERGRPAMVLSLPPRRAAVGMALLSHRSIRLVYTDMNGAPLTAVVEKPFHWYECADLASTVSEQLTQLLSRTPAVIPTVARIVVGVPMPYQRGRGVVLLGSQTPRPRLPIDRYPPWVHTDLEVALSKTHGITALVENDVNLAALGEADTGAAASSDSSIFLKIGLSLAAGIVVDNQLIRGFFGAAGELGHLPVDPSGPICYCGARGCLGTTANAHALLDSLRPIYGPDLAFADVLALAAQGDTNVRRVLNDLGRIVGRALASTMVMLNPEMLVIDGALGPAAVPIINGLTEEIARATPARIGEHLTIRVGELLDRAELTGAAAVARTSINK